VKWYGQGEAFMILQHHFKRGKMACNLKWDASCNQGTEIKGRVIIFGSVWFL